MLYAYDKRLTRNLKKFCELNKPKCSMGSTKLNNKIQHPTRRHHMHAAPANISSGHQTNKLYFFHSKL